MLLLDTNKHTVCHCSTSTKLKMGRQGKKAVKKVKKKSSSKQAKPKVQNKVKNSYMNYDQQSLTSALQECKNGGKIAEVSRKFHIPESTLHARLQGKHKDQKPGASTQLTDQEEQDLHTWILHCCEKGFPVTKEQLLDSVKIFLDQEERCTNFADNRPGRAWYERFMKKFTDISVRISENVNANRAKVSEVGIRQWFLKISTYLEKEGLLSIDASRVFNTDETPLTLNPKPQKVLAKKGCKDVYRITGNNEKENITVLITGNAIGQLAPPLVLFKGKSLPENVAVVGPRDYGYGYADNGYMTSECFYEFITNVFYPWLVKMKIKFPVVMYLDGHKSHITLPLSKFCREKEIVLIALYPNATHIIQLLDVAFFKALKVIWSKTYNDFCKNSGTIYLAKHQFAVALKTALENLDLSTMAKNGFRKCGLHPFNADSVDYTKIFRRDPDSKMETEDHPEVVRDDNSNRQVLEVLEKFMGSEILEKFQSNQDDTWLGEREHLSLYNVWFRMKQNLESNSVAKNLVNITSYIIN